MMFDVVFPSTNTRITSDRPCQARPGQELTALPGKKLTEKLIIIEELQSWAAAGWLEC